MNRDLLELLVAIGFGSIIAAFITGIFNRRNMSGSYANQMASAAATLVDPLKKRVTELEPLMGRVAELQDQILTMQRVHAREVHDLHEEILVCTETCARATAGLTEELAQANAELQVLRGELGLPAGDP